MRRNNSSNNMTIRSMKLRPIRLIGACLLIFGLVAVQLAQSTPTKGAASTKEQKAAAAGGTSREVSTSRGQEAAVAKSRQVAPAKRQAPVAKDPAGSKRFQSRMMSPAPGEQQVAPQSQQSPQQQGASNQQQESYFAGPDTWNPHSLVPTFTDQEQGDEMVALASEMEPEAHSVYKPLNGSRGLPMSEQQQRYRKQQRQPQPIGLSNEELAQAKANRQQSHRQQQQPPADEYYPDEEDDEEEPAKSLRSEFETLGTADRKSQAQKFRAIQQAESGHYQSDYFAPGSADGQSNNRRPEADQAPRSLAKQAASSQSSEAKWLPSSASQQQQTLATTISDQSLQTPRAESSPSAAKPVQKLAASFFGGRDAISSFSKTDAAIEYLKNLLKTKQSSRQQQSNNSSTVQQEVEDKPEAGNSNFYKLSSFASRLNQMLNTSSSINNSAATTTNDKFDYSPVQKAPISQFAVSQIIAAGSTGGAAKFSIVDAKPIKSSNQTAAATGTTTTTSRLPADILVPLSEQQYSGTHMEPSKPEPYSQDLPINTPNGTPLGGDYIESLDEFPRGFSHLPRQQQPSQQQQQQQLYTSESRLIPVVQQHDESKEPQASSEVSGTVDQAKEEAQAAYPPMQFDRAVYESFQRQLSGVPSSSKYFQLQQPPAVAVDYSNVQNAPIVDPVTKTDPPKAKDIQVPQQQPTKTQQVNQQPAEPAQQQQQSQAPVQHLQGRKTADRRPIQQQQPPAVQVPVPQFPGQSQPIKQQQQQPSPISNSKLYSANEQQTAQPVVSQFSHSIVHQTNQPQAQQKTHHYAEQRLPIEHDPRTQHSLNNLMAQQPAQMQAPHHQYQPQQLHPQQQPQKLKPPKIVSYNYFESPTEGGESELMTTNYQLGDTLYSSAGGVEQVLSNHELEAIQSQFLTASHPVVPLGSDHHNPHHQHQQQQTYQDSSLSGLLANLKPNLQPDALQKLNSPAAQAEETMKELASNESPMSIAALPQVAADEIDSKKANVRTEAEVGKKSKSLIVYLNHPRASEMSKVSSSPDEGYNLSQSIGDRDQFESFISAKEFDSHGLSKDSKQLDISSLNQSDLAGEIKEAQGQQDKDGLSVVVIGDAYKYKKIVLLISSKSGGLKFIPMVKDMKK